MKLKYISYLDFEKKEINLFFILFLIVCFVYGIRLFFTVYATDDYRSFYSFEGMSYLAGMSGRWMAAWFSNNIFTGPLSVLPYINSLLGIFSYTLSGFLTAKYWDRTNTIETSIITLLIATSPFVGHILYFSLATFTWLTTLFGVIGIVLAYNQNKFFKLFGFFLLVMAIGTYQTIIQVIIAMIIIKTMLEIMKANNLPEIKKIAYKAFVYISFVLLAFAISIVINKLYLDYNHLTITHRYKNAETVTVFSTYIDRLITMYKNSYNLSFGLKYFKTKFSFLYYALTILSIIGGLVFVLRNKISNKTKIISLILLTILFISIPLIINLPLITGNGVPTRAHYTIGWVLAGLFAIQQISFKKTFKDITSILAILIIILNIYYINVFFDAGNRQTNADMARINQIVNRIRLHRNYISEPLKFKIVGTKAFAVEGWNSGQQALNTPWSKYGAFKHFTDLNFPLKIDKKNPNGDTNIFGGMTNKDYSKVIKYIVDNGIKVNAYPAKNSIVVYKDNAVLFLNIKGLSKQMAKYEFEKSIDKKLLVKSNFSVYQSSNKLFYVKNNCTKSDIKHKFFLHMYPEDKSVLPKKIQKHGFKNMDFSFNSAGSMDNNICIASRELPDFKIKKFATGQYEGTKRNWDATYIFDKNDSSQ